MADTKLKCAACGKVSASSAFKAAALGQHEIEALEVDYVGGGRAGRPKDDDGKLVPGGKGGGFAWRRRDPRPEEVAVMVQAHEAALARLRGLELPTSKEDELRAELEDLRRKLKKRDKFILEQANSNELAATKIEQLQQQLEQLQQRRR